MAVSLRDLEARRGQSRRKKWDLLLEYLRRYRVKGGAGVKIRQTSDGTSVTARPERAIWPCAWRVLLASDGASVAPGRVAMRMATIDEIPLDGLDEEGLPTLSVPLLPLTKPAVGFESWVCVRVQSGKTGEDTDVPPEVVATETPDGRPPGPEAVAEARRSLLRGGSVIQEEGWVYHPLALVRWSSDGVPIAVMQCATHDFQIGWTVDATGGPNRAFFWPV
jgi:hypothetical protein